MNELAHSQAPADATEQANPIVLALLASSAVVLALLALVFWPTRSWTAPPRPKLTAPIVFDEFVNGPTPPVTPSSISSAN